MSSVMYELGCYIPEDDILQSPPRKPQILKIQKCFLGFIISGVSSNIHLVV
jgi:hypothetical protein